MSRIYEAASDIGAPVWFRYNHERRAVEWAYDIRVWYLFGRHNSLKEFYNPSCLRAIAKALKDGAR